MKRFKIKTITGVVTIIFMLCTAFSVYAANYSAKIELRSDSTVLKAGQTYKITARVKNINVGDRPGINVIQASVDYNTDVFEEIKGTNFKPLTGWDEVLYKKASHTFLASTGMDEETEKNRLTKADEDFLVLTLKVKDGVILTQSETITFKNIVATGGSLSEGGTGQFSPADVSIKLELASTATPTPTPTQTATPTSTPTQEQPKEGTKTETTDTTKTSSTSSTTSTKATENKSKVKLPAAGVASAAGIVVLVAGLGTVCYIRFKKMNSYK